LFQALAGFVTPPEKKTLKTDEVDTQPIVAWCSETLWYAVICPFGDHPLDARREHLHWRAAPLRSFAALRKEAGIFCGSFLRKGEVFAYVGRSQNLKDQKNKVTATHQPLVSILPGYPGKIPVRIP
jgi:hypothetical protein